MMFSVYRAPIYKRLRSPGIVSASLYSPPSGPVRQIGLSYRPPGWESIPEKHCDILSLNIVEKFGKKNQNQKSSTIILSLSQTIPDLIRRAPSNREAIYFNHLLGPNFCMEMSAATPVCNCASILTRRQFYEYIIPKYIGLSASTRSAINWCSLTVQCMPFCFFLFCSQNVVQLRERYQAVADHVSNNKNRFLQLLICTMSRKWFCLW